MGELGLHFVLYNVKFTKNAYKSKWLDIVDGKGNGDVDDVDPCTIELNEKDFPISKSRWNNECE